MKATSSSQKGFSVVEVVIVVVVVVLIGALVYTFINRPSQSSQPEQANTVVSAEAETVDIKNELDAVNIDEELDTSAIDEALR